MNLEDILSDITADLLAREQNTAFVERLFSMGVCKWGEVIALCDGLTEAESRLEELQEAMQGTLRVTWQDYPESSYGQGYCVIIFFLEELHWSNVALFNKQKFLENMTHGTDSP